MEKWDFLARKKVGDLNKICSFSNFGFNPNYELGYFNQEPLAIMATKQSNMARRYKRKFVLETFPMDEKSSGINEDHLQKTRFFGT